MKIYCSDKILSLKSMPLKASSNTSGVEYVLEVFLWTNISARGYERLICGTEGKQINLAGYFWSIIINVIEKSLEKIASW